MSIEQIAEPLRMAFMEFLAVFMIDIEKIFALIIIIIAGIFVARYGKTIIQKLIVKLFNNKWVTKHTKINSKDFEKQDGLKSLVTLIPKLISSFILFFFFMAGLNVLEFTQASESLSEVWSFIPNIAVFVVLLVFGSIATKIGNEWFKKEGKIIGKTSIPKYGFNAAIWFSVLTIGFTQLGIGAGIIPIIVGGVMGSLIVIIYGLRSEIQGYVNIESVKTMGIENGVKVILDTREYTVTQLGITHTKFLNDHGDTLLLNNKHWHDRIIIVNESKD